MVYFKFLSEITDIGLRISFKESGVKFTDGSKDFRHYRPNDVKEIQRFKIRTGDVRPQVGGEGISQKNRYIKFGGVFFSIVPSTYTCRQKSL